MGSANGPETAHAAEKTCPDADKRPTLPFYPARELFYSTYLKVYKTWLQGK
jgi:hypothetical protein